jgi:cytochrome c peroxidase
MFNIVLMLALACNSNEEIEKVETNSNEELEQSKVIFGTISSIDEINPDTKAVSLGKALYSEKALSGNGTQSCEDCHLLDRSGTEPLSVSVGAYGKPVHRNAPTTFNSKFHIAQFWDGRAKDLQEQAGGPILAAGEMGTKSKETAVEAISSIDKYPEMFEEAFGSKEVTFEKITYAIAEFEKTLVTNDRFDQWMLGSEKLTDDEINGMKKFIEVGCASCHNGPLLGANSYRKLGQVRPYMTESEHVDLGRYNVTKQESDKQVFKVPSLRNVTNTWPYFHDGSIKTIEEAILIMGKYQLGVDLTEDDLNSIVTFLKTMENTNSF